MNTEAPINPIDPHAVHAANQEFLRRKSDDTLDDLDTRSTETKRAVEYLDENITLLRDEKRQTSISADQRLILRTRISNATRLRGMLVADRKKLRARLSEFASKEIQNDRIDQIKADAKDTAKRKVWEPALEKNLRKLPTDIYRKATTARLQHTKEKYTHQADTIADIAVEKNHDLQRDTTERFLKEYRPEWWAKMSGDAEYRERLISILISAINDNKSTSYNKPNEVNS